MIQTYVPMNDVLKWIVCCN